MKPLQLDFSSHEQQQRNKAGAIAAVFMLLLLAGLLLQHRDILSRTAQLEAQANIGIGQTTTRPIKLTEPEQRETKAALDTQRALNLPWNELLTTLEKVQEQTTKVHLISVQPNAAKGEVVINGEARDFGALMEYAQALRTHKTFSDVVLLNQRHVEENGRQRLEFALSAEWTL